MASRLFFKTATPLSFAAIAVASAPVAFAESPRRSIYDNDKKEEELAPVPGTIEAGKAREGDIEKFEKEHGVQVENVGGVTIKSPKALESNIKVAREWFAAKVEEGNKYIDEAFNKYLAVENSVTKTVADLKSPQEDVLPAGIYITVAALSGSILTRNRNILFRSAVPLAFGVAAFSYFLPQTAHNTGALIWKYEQKVPEVAKAHEDAKESVDSFAKNVRKALDDGKTSLESGVHSTRKFIADSTGLQLPDVDEKKKK
ncbi:MICOS complex subunit [Yarrowia sp. B02]|nr:MICOS complex subunit [Yarrowia sp. B02]